MNDRSSPRVNVALQGGGSHGAFTWGVLDRLLEDGRLEFEGLSGASAGAVNAALFVHGWLEDGRDGARAALSRFWHAVGGVSGIFGSAPPGPWVAFFTRALSPYQFNPANLNPLRSLLASQIDFERLRSSAELRLFVSATNVRTNHVRIFRGEEIGVDAVMASACLPMVFQAVEIDGEAYWDGGYLADPPLYPFFYECSTRDLLVVMINPLERVATPNQPGDILDRINEISFNASLIAEMRAIAFVHKLLDEGWLKKQYESKLRNVLVHLVRADGVLTGLGSDSKYQTSLSFLLDLHERGRTAADDWLKKNLRHVGRRSSIDIRRTFLEG
ncbi:MAG: patatin-like phospholipase family protein [Burkholderiaceae bacterium]|jgi:NTE family protein|nr:patatin-like phospholipase family protein [Burkholderiaceae bacterium]MEB2317707.1 patatin-like phospholipase family protein [Pseudomonadota bacterium]